MCRLVTQKRPGPTVESIACYYIILDGPRMTKIHADSYRVGVRAE